jgi:hypothetical protein
MPARLPVGVIVPHTAKAQRPRLSQPGPSFLMPRHRPDRVEELSRIASTVCGGERWGRGMGDYFAAASLLVLVLWGVRGVLMQDKFRL